jgi:hypothetical protein
MLKDGTSEVWPEDVEKIFIQGLREYWESPWATFSRGRSRWRNQFLVDYLQKAGIERSRKQVASHIQVLRNMWKGEPEFHLVAGGEELFQENGLLSQQNSPDTRQSSMAASTRGGSGERDPIPSSPPSSDSSSDSERSPMTDVMQLHVHTDVKASPSYSSATLASPTLMQPTYSPSHFQDVAPTQTCVRLSRLQIWANGLDPFTVEVDALTSSPKPYSRVMLRLKLCISPMSDTNTPASLHGFSGAIVLSQPWAHSGKCFTRVFTTNTCISKELDYLRATNQNLTALLPDSWLTKSRWLEATSRSSITQQIIVDDEVIAFIVYDLDRGMDSRAGPSVELTGFQKYAGNKDTESSVPAPSTSSYYSSNAGSSRFVPLSSHVPMQIPSSPTSDIPSGRSYQGI